MGVLLERLRVFFRPKIIALIQYLLYGIGGVVFVFLPSQPMRLQASVIFIVCWHIFLVLGGTISASGVLRKKIALEAVGIPLLMSSLLAYTVVLFASAFSDDEGAGGRLGLACLLFASFIGLLGRLADLMGLIHIAEDVDRRDPDGA